MMIQAGHRLAVLARSKQVHFALHNAAWQERFTLVPLPPDAPVHDLRGMLEAARVDVVVTDQMTAPAAQAIRGERPTMLLSDQGDPASHTDGRLEAPQDTGDTYVVVRTSGTTGTPAWVELPRSAIAAHREAAMKRLGCREDSIWLHTLPPHHMGGISMLDRCLHGGGRLVLEDGFDTERALLAMQQHGVTHTSLVPTMLRRLMDRGPPPDDLECVLVGGDRLPDASAQQALDAGWPVYASYGLTEACGQVATARPEELRAAPGTVGTPLDGVEVHVEGDPEEVGEIVVSGPTCVGTVHTGDLGRFDEAGRLFVVGRRDARITTGGKKVDPIRVEEVLAQYDAVTGVCVFGMSDEEWGQRVVAAVEADGDLDEAALRAHCRARLEPHEIPKEIRIVESLPRSSLGKIQRVAVQEQW